MTPAQQAALEACAGRPLVQADFDVLEPLLPGRNDVAIAAHLSIGRVRYVHVPIAAIQAYMQSHGIWWVLKTAAADPTHAGQQAAAAVMEVASARYENIDLRLSFVGFILSALVTSGLMSADDLAAFSAMGQLADPVHYNEVSDRLNIAEGRLTLEGFKNGQ